MSAKISHASVYSQPGLNTSIEISALAGKACIAESGLTEADVGLLLNVGVYRDSNLHEPAAATLIQGRAGLNGNPLRDRSLELGSGHTFSFDLLNGACGFFNAVQVAESFLDTDSARAVLIVASDVHPSMRPREDFPYAPLGAAMLLTRASGIEGFRRLVHRTTVEDYVGSRSYADLVAAGTEGRDVMTIEDDVRYDERLGAFAARSLAEYLDEEWIDAARIKRVVAPRAPAMLRRTIVDVVGVPEERIVDVDSRFGRTFTAMPILGYHLAKESGLDEGDAILFVNAGAGLTFGCGMYVC